MKLIESIDETKKQKKTKKIKSRLASWELFFLGEIILERVVAVVVVVVVVVVVLSEVRNCRSGGRK